MKVLVLGASGMLGSAVFRVLSEAPDWLVYGTLRSETHKRFFQVPIVERLLVGVDVEQHDSLVQAFVQTRPDIVINCIGLVKQLAEVNDPLRVIPINTLLPHRLAKLCELAGARLIHISTDCVFSGEKGGYSESDVPDARDLYGRSKYLGEVAGGHALTLRTSIIGHELQSSRGLVEWFLSRTDRCEGYARVIFSGVPAVVLAAIIRDVLIPRPDLSGTYHLAATPISKFELLKLIAEVYEKRIEIVPEDHPVIDRSLDATRLLEVTGYSPPQWEEMIAMMKKYR
jgi:dTDP-4-dehydrorhamnose reductase